PLLQAIDAIKLKTIYTSKVDQVTRRWPDVIVTQSLEDIWDDPDIELVVIASPNATHSELIARSLESGKHTVVDKPFVMDVKDGRRLIELAKRKGLKLSVYQNRRWDSGFLTVQKLLNDNRLG